MLLIRLKEVFTFLSLQSDFKPLDGDVYVQNLLLLSIFSIF